MKDAAAERIPIFVAGVGQTGPVAADPRSITEMVCEAVQAALDDAGAGFDSIDAVVTASVDLFDGLTASNIAVTEVVGAVMKPETRIAADGLGAVVHAACQIWAGAYRTVLVVAHGKASMSDYQSLTEWAMDPIYLQPLGVNFLACAGLQAGALAAREKQGAAELRWAEVAAERRAGAHGDEILSARTADEILRSPIVASPLREAMCAPMADGACAALLTCEVDDSARSSGVTLRAIGHDLAAHGFSTESLGSWPGLARAARRAYAMAGIDNPKFAFDLMEPSCLYPHEEELFLDAAGLDESCRLSPEGGLFAGAVPVAAGLSRMISATRAMRRDPECARALTHGTWGPAGQGQALAILERAS